MPANADDRAVVDADVESAAVRAQHAGRTSPCDVALGDPVERVLVGPHRPGFVGGVRGALAPDVLDPTHCGTGAARHVPINTGTGHAALLPRSRCGSTAIVAAAVPVRFRSALARADEPTHIAH